MSKEHLNKTGRVCRWIGIICLGVISVGALIAVAQKIGLVSAAALYATGAIAGIIIEVNAIKEDRRHP